MNEEKFEKYRKGTEILLDIIFLFNLFSLIVMGVFKVLYLKGKASVDMFNYQQIIIQTISTVFLYISTRLARRGHIFAGIIGIIIALTEILLSGTIWKIVGVLLLIDSLMYLINYKKA